MRRAAPAARCSRAAGVDEAAAQRRQRGEALDERVLADPGRARQHFGRQRLTAILDAVDLGQCALGREGPQGQGRGAGLGQHLQQDRRGRLRRHRFECVQHGAGFGRAAQGHIQPAREFAGTLLQQGRERGDVPLGQQRLDARPERGRRVVAPRRRDGRQGARVFVGIVAGCSTSARRFQRSAWRITSSTALGARSSRRSSRRRTPRFIGAKRVVAVVSDTSPPLRATASRSASVAVSTLRSRNSSTRASPATCWTSAPPTSARISRNGTSRAAGGRHRRGIAG